MLHMEMNLVSPLFSSICKMSTTHSKWMVWVNCWREWKKSPHFSRIHKTLWQKGRAENDPPVYLLPVLKVLTSIVLLGLPSKNMIRTTLKGKKEKARPLALGASQSIFILFMGEINCACHGGWVTGEKESGR